MNKAQRDKVPGHIPVKVSADHELVDYATVDAALAVARLRNDTTSNGSPDGGHRDHGSANWSGTKTFAEADRLAVEGWPEGLAKAEAMRAQLCGVMGSRSLKPRLTRHVAGFAPCVPSAIAGDPESMFNLHSVMTENAGKIIHIVYNNCVSAGLTAQTLMLRGAICMALVDTLESCGFRCQVTLASGCRQSGQHHDVFIGLKTPEEHLNVDTLAFWLVHPSAFRRMIFAIWENVWEGRCGFPCLGMPTGIKQEERRGDIYLSEANLANVNNQTAIPFLKSTLQSYGVEFEG